ncbi:MAG TPA: hypothetical protein VLJ21_00915 [Candidatus Binatia bacterium]|nr:hypothetical protein [Candidatus Binatia bacterium]
MVTVDAHALKKRAPADRIDEIQVLRKALTDELKKVEAHTQKQEQLLDELEKEARRELATTDRIRVPEAREVEVERLFKRKKLEEELEDAPRLPQQRVEYTTRDALQAVYSFREHHGYEHIASIRDKVAAGETLSSLEQQTLRRYDQLVHEFERVSSSIRDERAKDLMNRTEKAIHQIESYKTRKMNDEDEKKQRQEF